MDDLLCDVVDVLSDVNDKWQRLVAASRSEELIISDRESHLSERIGAKNTEWQHSRLRRFGITATNEKS